MKKIKFTCPHCASVLRVPGHLAGVSGPCPKCATTITAPSESDESTIDVIPVKSGTALAAAITGTGSGNSGSATATLPPPVKATPESSQMREQYRPQVVETVVVEAKMAQPEYASTPSALPSVPVERVMAPVSTPPPLLPSQYEAPIESPSVVPGSYAEPLLNEPVIEKPAEVVTPPPPLVEPEPEPVQQVAIPVPVPLEEAVVTPPVLVEPIPLVEPVPSDIVEPDISASTLPPTLEPGIPVGEPLVPPSQDAPKSESPKIAIPKTQPIQIIKASTVMPPDRNEVEIEPTPPPGPAIELPRLDVSLADAETGGTSDLQQFQQKEPTRIQLPELDDIGAEVNSLDDFTAVSEPMESLVEAPESRTEPIALPPENNLDYSPQSETVEIPIPPVEIPVVASHGRFVPPDPEVAMALEKQLLQELSAAHPPIEETTRSETEQRVEPEPVSVTPVEDPSPDSEIAFIAAPEERVIESEIDREPRPLIEQPDLHEPEETSPTNEGSMANMLGIAKPESENEMSSDLGLESVPRSEHRAQQEPVVDRSMPVEEPTPAPLAPVPETESNSELDVFDELLGRATPGGKAGPPWVILGAIVVSVAILATLMGIFVWHSFGGGSEPLAEQDKELLDQKYSIISSGSSSESSAEKLEAVNALDMSLPSETEATAKKNIDAPAIKKGAEPPLIVNEDAQSSITLPGDGDRVTISDGSGKRSVQPPAVLGPISDSGEPATFGGGSAPEPVAKVKNLGTGENTISALDDKIAKMGADTETQLGDAPAVQDPPAQFKPTDTVATPAPRNVDPAVGFPAPTANDPPLGQSREVIDAFIRAADWQSRIPFTYQGDSLRPAIEDYYKKWSFSRADKFSIQLFQMEQDETLGGPYWVYLVSTSDSDAGFPVIVRVENGKLKVDWEIYSEFQDQHFVRFREGTIASPHSFRVVLEQKSDYFGEDRDEFKDRQDYLCFEVSPPYGSPGAFSQFAFVKKGSALAAEINKYIGLGEDLLAVVVTLDYKEFPHGKKHMVITKWITEGWFQ